MASGMESKAEGPPVWGTTSEQDQTAGQVHFVPESNAVAQIVYTDEQDRPPQQVVYTADGTSYTSVDGTEHTLVYIHQSDGAQTVFTDQSQVAYIQQDATTQQVTVLLPTNQNVTGTNLAVLGSVTEAQQPMTESNSQALLPVSNNGIHQITGDNNSVQQIPEAMDSAEPDLDFEEEEDEEEEDDDVDSSDVDDWEPGPPRPFNPCDLWCEDCNKAHPSACLKHGALHCIPNRPVLSRARASLPLILYINRFAGGIFSKRRIPKRTQFGPVEGPLVKQSELKDNYIHLKIAMGVGREDCKDEEKPADLWFDLSDENLCNWMMFVRQAQNHLEQNLVVYQYGKNLYFTTIKHIEPKQELKVWYAASYADFVERKIHDISEEERKVLRDQEKNWPCYECNRRFTSSEQLQQHLNMHDEKLDFFSRSKCRGRGRGRRRFGPGRRPGRPPKFNRQESTTEQSQQTLQFAMKHHFEDADEPVANGMDQEEDSAIVSEQPENDSSVANNTASTGPGEELWRNKRIRNAALHHLFIRKTFRPFKCLHCGKAFREKEKLDQHLHFHGREGNYPLTCDICNKGFINSSALDSHMKFHSDQKTYSCIFCTESFDRLDLLREHVTIHVTNGCFTCPSCKKQFPDFIQIKKHIRSFHSEKVYQCTECDKAFCRPDKLRLHMLRHSDRKDFLCSTCGKQFKRKDKLKEHMQRMHNPEREAKNAGRIHKSKPFKPKIPSTDYESFMFKCRACMMGFRRRGMLVNHLSKRHPDIRIDDVPELTLPIIKPNRDYYCQYCDKVYKSASKRKAHILKNHPGAELPPSIRKLRPAAPGEPDPMLSTHTQLKGTIATLPVCCPHCCKQYSSKAKMVQHIRKKHTDVLQENPNALQTLPAQTPIVATVISAAPTVVNTDGSAGDTIVTTDLLTQAMSELSQTLTTDYRPPQGDYHRVQYIPVSQHIQPVQGQQPQHIQLQVVQVAQASSPQQNQHSTVDVSQLHDSHAFSQHSVQVQHVQVPDQSTAIASTGSQAGGGQPLSPSAQPPQELSPSQIQGGTSTQNPVLQQQPAASVQHTYLPSTWGSFRNYSSEIQMMTIPQTQYVIAEGPVATVNSGQVKAVTQTHYVISEGQPELDVKQNAAVRLGVPQTQTDTTLQQPNAQFIITSTASGNGSTEVPITKP